MHSTPTSTPSRRQFALSGLALGASALTATHGALAADKAPVNRNTPSTRSGRKRRNKSSSARTQCLTRSGRNQEKLGAVPPSDSCTSGSTK